MFEWVNYFRYCETKVLKLFTATVTRITSYLPEMPATCVLNRAGLLSTVVLSLNVPNSSLKRHNSSHSSISQSFVSSYRLISCSSVKLPTSFQLAEPMGCYPALTEEFLSTSVLKIVINRLNCFALLSVWSEIIIINKHTWRPMLRPIKHFLRTLYQWFSLNTEITNAPRFEFD